MAVIPGGDHADIAGPREDPVSIPLSALEHVAYRQRQAALIHVEATWADSVDTVRGDLAHRAVDLRGPRRRHNMTSVRSLPVGSRRYGLHGTCDLVEISGDTSLPGPSGSPMTPGGPCLTPGSAAANAHGLTPISAAMSPQRFSP